MAVVSSRISRNFVFVHVGRNVFQPLCCTNLVQEPTNFYTYLLIYLHTYVLNYLFTNLHTYLLTHILTYLFTYIHTYIHNTYLVT